MIHKLMANVISYRMNSISVQHYMIHKLMANVLVGEVTFHMLPMQSVPG